MRKVKCVQKFAEIYCTSLYLHKTVKYVVKDAAYLNELLVIKH